MWWCVGVCVCRCECVGVWVWVCVCVCVCMCVCTQQQRKCFLSPPSVPLSCSPPLYLRNLCVFFFLSFAQALYMGECVSIRVWAFLCVCVCVCVCVCHV